MVSAHIAHAAHLANKQTLHARDFCLLTNGFFCCLTFCLLARPAPTAGTSMAQDPDQSSEDEAVRDEFAEAGPDHDEVEVASSSSVMGSSSPSECACSSSSSSCLLPSEALLASSLCATLGSCSLLYGMHADGATEALVDYALAHHTDFAVVPCCVFPDAAPHRRIRVPKAATTTPTSTSTAGDASSSSSSSSSTSVGAAADSEDQAEWVPVRSYPQFLDYLQAKHPSIQRTDLAFEGRNTCIWRRVSPSPSNSFV